MKNGNGSGGFAAILISVFLDHGACRPIDCRRKGGAGSEGLEGSEGAVRRIKIGKRREVSKYTLFTKDEKPVNLLNLQNPLNL